MKYLLDTRTFLWLATGDDAKLHPGIVKLFLDNSSEIVLSVVSAWKISIKSSIGKLDMKVSVRDFLETQITENGLSLLNVTLDHAIKAAELPFHHPDPFDRLLISQSMIEKIPILTSDMAFRKYDIEVIP